LSRGSGVVAATDDDGNDDDAAAAAGGGGPRVNACRLTFDASRSPRQNALTPNGMDVDAATTRGLPPAPMYC